MEYTGKKNPNLIDTPDTLISHTKFHLPRPVKALLIVDAAQSIQAQTISNLYLALENDLKLFHLIKWTSANPEEVSDDIVDLLGCKLEEIIHASGKLV
jgi:GTP-binding protein LepA